MVAVKIMKLSERATLPQYQTEGASGCDVSACLANEVTIRAGGRDSIPTGLSVEIPCGYELQVRPRSGLAFKQGLTVLNTPGTIDSDYRGEVRILVVNLGAEAVTVRHGDRIAQWVLQKVDRVEWQETATLSSTVRDAGGFGSTGLRCEESR